MQTIFVLLITAQILALAACQQRAQFSGQTQSKNGSNLPTQSNTPKLQPKADEGSNNSMLKPPNGKSLDGEGSIDCKEGQFIPGLDLLILVDNSRSMIRMGLEGEGSGTDCRTKNGTTCSEKTYREKAMEKAFRSIIKRDSQYLVETNSTIEVNVFTPSGADIQSAYLEVNEENMEIFEESIAEFLRKPKGDTPYLTAANLAEKWIIKNQNRPTEKKIIMISDGLPTDPNPKETLDKFQSLAYSPKLYIVNKDNRTLNALIGPHKFNMKNLAPYNPLNQWRDAKYQDDNSYLSELISIPKKLGVNPEAPAITANQLPEIITEEVQPTTRSCQNTASQ